MNTYDHFLRLNKSLLEQCREGEYVRVEVQGIEVIHIVPYEDARFGDTMIVQGFDNNDVETELVFPASHFSARLAIVPKKRERPGLGFKLPKV